MHIWDVRRRWTEPFRPFDGGLTREQLVNQIMSLNTTATVGFLDRFDETELNHYLQHLLAASRPRGRRAVWVRRDGEPGIVISESAA